MKRSFGWILVFAMFAVVSAGAARVRVTHHGRRTTVTVRRGFPITRPLPAVYVRPPRVAVRVAPAVYLPRVEFRAAVVTLPAPTLRVWTDSETIDAGDGWTEFTLNADRRGRQLMLDVSNGRAQISFAEVVFDNGDAQVVDFGDQTYSAGTYLLLDFRDGRKVDHVRMVANARSGSPRISLHLIQ